MIGLAVRRKPEAVPEQCLFLWTSLADKLTPIIGAGGFDTLLARSLQLALPAYPWLPQQHTLATRLDFTVLRGALAGRDPAEAAAATTLLLTTFIDTLTLLIGASLTHGILLDAWGDALVNPAVTEPPT